MALRSKVSCCPRHERVVPFVYDRFDIPHCPICDLKEVLKIKKYNKEQEIKSLEKEVEEKKKQLKMIEGGIEVL